MIEHLLREEDNSLILNKIKIHEELKNNFIDKTLTKFKTHEFLKIKNNCMTNSRATAKPDFLNTSKVLINSSTISSINKIPHRNNSPTQSSHNISMMNDSNIDIIGKKAINNLDFNTEKYNIISSSPIHTPIIKQKMSKIKIDQTYKYSRSIEYENKKAKEDYLQTEHEEYLSDMKYSIDKKNNSLLMSEKTFKKSTYISPIVTKKTKGNLKSIANVTKEITIKTNINDISRDRTSVTSTGKKKSALTSFTNKLKK
jgi:hypothetical protein